MPTPMQSPALAALPQVSHGFFGRQGGVSSGLYTSLNCGIGSRDERTNVIENRRRVARRLGTTGDRLLTCYQVHSPLAVMVERPWMPDAQPRADAMVTRMSGLALGALAADCTPVLFADAGARVIAAAHAGWRGALGGILEATLDLMEEAGARRADIVAAVGPCIGPSAYEVGPEFEASFIAADDTYSRFFSKPRIGARAYFDLPGFCAERLKRANTGRIDVVAPCTYATPDRFFSFRRTTHAGEPDYGRQISAIMMSQ